MLLVFFYSTWKHQKAWDFRMFFRGRGTEETDGMKWVNTHYLDQKLSNTTLNWWKSTILLISFASIFSSNHWSMLESIIGIHNKKSMWSLTSLELALSILRKNTFPRLAQGTISLTLEFVFCNTVACASYSIV